MSDTSELRQDLITGKWVVIAKGRLRRPHDLARVAPARAPLPVFVESCPFCNRERFPQATPTLVHPRRGKWLVQAFPNKFPAFTPASVVSARKVGPYTVMDGVGFHEVILVRPHDGTIARLPRPDLETYIRAWRERYQKLMVKPSVAYIQLIENHGPESGGSLAHPHMQLFAIPVLPSDEVLDLLRGAENYFTEHGRCAHCDILRFEREAGTRIVWENEAFTVLCPFTSRVPNEQWILPRAHAPGFEALHDAILPKFAEALQEATRRLDAAFGDPAYNLTVYSAPCDTEGYVCDVDEFQHFHWHVQILPRMTVWGGFEIATGLEMHSVLPEEAAAFLRQQ